MLKHLDPESVLSELESGASLRQIASRIGCSNVGLRAWLLRCDDERYHQVVTTALTIRVAEADEALETADDAVSIARAREVARFSRMDYERRRPTLYGTKPAIAIGVTGGEGGVQLVVYDGAMQPRIRDVMLSADEAASTVDAEPGDALSPDGDDSTP